jgi:hypothetical protein
MENHTFTVRIHEAKFCKDELLINPECFPNVKNKDYLEISTTPTNDSVVENNEEHGPPKRVILQVQSLAEQKGNMQLSVLKDVASALGIVSSEKLRVIHVLPSQLQRYALEVVEVSFKDQYLSRADIWYFKRQTAGRSL